MWTCLTKIWIREAWTCLLPVGIINHLQWRALLFKPWSKWWKCRRHLDMYVQVQDLLSWVVRLVRVLSLNHLYHAASIRLRPYSLAGPWLQKCLIWLRTSKQAAGISLALITVWSNLRGTSSKMLPPTAANQHYPYGHHGASEQCKHAGGFLIKDRLLMKSHPAFTTLC